MIHYKIVWNTPKKTHEKVTIIKRATSIESFNTIEDLQYIEAFTIHKGNTLQTVEITEHNTGTLEVFGKMVTITGITPDEYNHYKYGIKFTKSLIDSMCTNITNNKPLI